MDNDLEQRRVHKHDSNDGFAPCVWGPALWHFLYTAAFNYPVHPQDEDKDVYGAFVLNVGKILPCRKCRDNFSPHVKGALLACNYEALLSRDKFSRFIHDLHTRVNRGRPNTRQGAEAGPQMPPPYETVRDTFTRVRAGPAGDGVSRKCVVTLSDLSTTQTEKN